MRPIFINGRFLSQPVTGAQRYGRELLSELDVHLAGSKSILPLVTVLVPASVKMFPSYQHLQICRVGRFSGQLWEQLELPFHARKGLLFTPCGGAPMMHRRNVVTIHDAAVRAAPQGYSPAFRTWYGFLNRFLCRSALHLFTVSQFSKAELIKWYGANPEKTTVTYLGSQHALRPSREPEVLTRNLLCRFNYVLLVASNNPNKNIEGLIRALPFLASSGIQVAIAGQKDSKVFGDRAVSDERVRNLGYVNESELRTLYENAACFVFPSFYEGFGLPPLEAMALGCPAVVSESTSLKEIFRGIALLCDPHNPSDIADKILQALKAPEEDRQRNRKFADGFRWDECARTTWSLILRLSQA